jgi:hypothetical protein
MSVIETLAQARKERLQRIAASAVPQAATPAGARPGEPTVARSRAVPDRNYERMWAAVIMGVGGQSLLRPRVVDILRATALQFGITPDEILAEGHTRKFARPRHVAMYLAKRLTPKSLAEIGRAFAGRDHTTVFHAVKGIETRLGIDGELAHHVACIREELEDIHSGKGEDQS